MQASFDPGLAKTGSFAAIIWKDCKPVEWSTFIPRVSEPLLSVCQDLTEQVLAWMYKAQRKHEALITHFALESFVDYQPAFKNKNLANLNTFRGYFAHALHTFNGGFKGAPREVLEICKGKEPKDVAELVVHNQFPQIPDNPDIIDAVYIGIHARYDE